MANARVGLFAGLASLALLHYFWRSTRRPKAHHPPSPASLPLVGNLFSIPPGYEYIAFTKLGEQVKSDIVFLEILGQKIIILNAAEDALALLEKRSALYSDRPTIPMLKDPSLMDWGRIPSLIGYNDTWRHYRRIMNNWLNMRAVSQFNDLQERQARILLQRLLSATEQSQPFAHVQNEIFFAMASLMFQLAYGYTLQGPQDSFFREIKLAFDHAEVAGMHTNFLVNLFPALSYVPDWFPGTSWKCTAREWRTQHKNAKNKPYEWLKAQIASGTQKPSLLSSLLPDHSLLSELSPAERDDRLKEVGGMMYAGGTDTTSNLLISLVVALILNPHVQARAQQELDTVLGHGVLPRLSDRERLPYVRNLIEEVMRVYPVAPLAAPHTCYQDDIYKGYTIQKGTAVIGNVWAMTRDPRHYKDPEVFDPDRFLDPDVPRAPVFGWGRRQVHHASSTNKCSLTFHSGPSSKCPGIYFGEASTFITTASLLATYTFSKKRDESGQEITPKIEVESNSFITVLKAFDFDIKPRSDEHRRLIIEAAEE